MTKPNGITAHGPTRRFLQCTLVLLALSLCLVGCTPPPSEITVNSARYDIARALLMIGRMHAGDEALMLFQSSYEALFDEALEVLTADELDHIEAAFADMQPKDVFNLLARFDPCDDKWLEPSGASASDPDQIKLMRLAWDRFLRDWDAQYWRAQRASALTAFDRESRFNDEPFVLVPRWFDAPVPEPHVLFYMPAALGTGTYLLRIDAGYAMVGHNVVRQRRTPDLAEHVIDSNWLLELTADEMAILSALAEHSGGTAAEAREIIIHVLSQASREWTGQMDGMMDFMEEVWAEHGWPGLVTALDRRIRAAWSAGKKLTEQDVWSVLNAWLAQAGN